MHTGGCLCGAVRYRVSGDFEEVAACHCHQCKQAQGGAFALNAPLSTQVFELLQGQEALREYRHTAAKARVFCGHCGSALYSRRDDLPGVLRLRLGTLDSPQLPAPHYHIHTASMVDWCDFAAEAPRYPGGKPG